MIGYEAPLKEWKKRKAQIDLDAETAKPHRKEYERAILVRQDLATWCRANGEHEQAEILTKEADELLRRFNLPNPPRLSPAEADAIMGICARDMKDYQRGMEISPITIPGRWETLRAVWEDRLAHLHAQVEIDKTLGANVDSYLKLKEAKANIGELSPGYLPPCRPTSGGSSSSSADHFRWRRSRRRPLSISTAT